MSVRKTCSLTPYLCPLQQTPKATSVPAPGPTHTPLDSQWVSLQTAATTAANFLLNDVAKCSSLWLCVVLCRGSWGNWPWRDHTQETRDHSAWIHSLFQWVTRHLKDYLLLYSPLVFLCFFYHNNTELSGCHKWLLQLLCYCKVVLSSTLNFFSCKERALEFVSS